MLGGPKARLVDAGRSAEATETSEGKRLRIEGGKRDTDGFGETRSGVETGTIGFTGCQFGPIEGQAYLGGFRAGDFSCGRLRGESLTSIGDRGQ